jgi:hypothetical protein
MIIWFLDKIIHPKVGGLTPRQPPLQVVDGTLDDPAPTGQNVGVDHGRFDVLMPEKFLNRSDQGRFRAHAWQRNWCRSSMEFFIPLPWNSRPHKEVGHDEGDS